MHELPPLPKGDGLRCDLIAVAHQGVIRLNDPVIRSVDRVFHVSPLIAMDASYGFRVFEPAQRLNDALFPQIDEVPL